MDKIISGDEESERQSVSLNGFYCFVVVVAGVGAAAMAAAVVAFVVVHGGLKGIGN